MKIEELKALEANATPGPWGGKPKRLIINEQEGPIMSWQFGNGQSPEGMRVSLGSERIADHALVSALRNAAPALIACAEALQMLYNDNVEYLEINRLSGMDNHCLKAAREALRQLEGVK